MSLLTDPVERETLSPEQYEQKYKRAKSIQQLVYHLHEKGTEPTYQTLIQLAYTADQIIKEAKLQYADKVAQLLQHKIITRNDTTDYYWRQIPHFNIGNDAYGLTPQNKNTPQRRLTTPKYEIPDP